MSYLAHDDVNGLYHVDHEWHRFLRNYKKQLKNSFLFVMGDHGIRFGSIRNTKQGELEDNNPAMLVVVPEHLRYNTQLMENLRNNSRNLVTHYDTYATMLNIAREGKTMTVHTKFGNQPKTDAWGIKLHGESYLYPFNLSTPRNCGNQLIPFDYCICQFNSETRTTEKQPLAVRLANHMIERMNHEIEVNNASELCVPLMRDNASDVELMEWEPEWKTNVYHVTYQTQPGGGKFWVYVQVFNEDGKGGNETYKMISDKMPRLNSYADEAFCTDDAKVKSYCYCRYLLSSTTLLGTTPTKTDEAAANASTTIEMPTT
ncbi:Protein R03G8.3 [Aphelenchoides avenae]|nr:Protein R03G8.3 [Aphelenchus avenae]